MEPKEFGKSMRDLREKKRLSLRDAAKGVMSVTYLWQIEKGQRTPSAEILKRLAPVYDVSVEHLLRVAGYLEEPKMEMTELERLEWAFSLATTDREYKFGTYLRGSELTPEVKRYIVEAYEKASGKKLL
jgi:transcriptional regulator with XRE-family HTH domain